MDILDLKKSVSDMSDEELMNLIKDVRQSRRLVKRAPTEAKKYKAEKKMTESKVSIDDLIKNLSPEQINAMLAKRGGK